MGRNRIIVFLSSILFVLFIAEASISGVLSSGSTLTGHPWLLLLLNGPNPDAAFSLVTPYINESDIKEIRSGFSTSKDNPPPPWGYVHDGYDMYPNLDPTHPDVGLKPFQAALPGQ